MEATWETGPKPGRTDGGPEKRPVSGAPRFCRFSLWAFPPNVRGGNCLHPGNGPWRCSRSLLFRSKQAWNPGPELLSENKWEKNTQTEKNSAETASTALGRTSHPRKAREGSRDPTVQVTCGRNQKGGGTWGRQDSSSTPPALQVCSAVLSLPSPSPLPPLSLPPCFPPSSSASQQHSGG